MSDYKALKGIAVKSISGDPTSLTGQVWYDSAANAFQCYRSVGAWAAGGTTNFLTTSAGSCGSQTAGLLTGGYDETSNLDKTDEYNGVDWTAGGTLNEVKQGPGVSGTQTAAFCAGGKSGPYPSGSVTVNSEEYNGVDWTEGNNLQTSRMMVARAGTQTAGLVMAGYIPGSWCRRAIVV